jgi:hypothetical protein
VDFTVIMSHVHTVYPEHVHPRYSPFPLSSPFFKQVLVVSLCCLHRVICSVSPSSSPSVSFPSSHPCPLTSPDIHAYHITTTILKPWLYNLATVDVFEGQRWQLHQGDP